MCEKARAAQPDGLVGRPYKLAVLALCLVNVAHFYSIASLFAYAGFLAVDNGWAEDEDSAGFVVGVLATMVPLSRIPTSALWGHAADRFGRKPALVATMASVLVGNLLFGVTRRLSLAIVVRFCVLGMGNGWPTLIGIVAREVGGPRQARVLSTIFGFGGIVQLIGPAVGGLTYRAVPAFPALVPSIVGAALAALAIAALLAFLPETRPPRHPPKADDDEAAAGAPPPKASSKLQLVCAAPLRNLILLRAGFGFMGFMMIEVIPLFGIATAESAGLALDHRHLGMLLAAAASLTVVYQLAFMGRVVESLSLRATLAIAVADAVGLMAMPHTRGLPLAATGVLISLNSATMTTVSAAVLTSMNRATDAHAHRRGAINGAATTCEAIGKASGPALGAPAFAAFLARAPHGAEPAFAVFGSFLLGLAIAGTLLQVDDGTPPWRRWVKRRLQRERVKSTTAEEPVELIAAAAQPST